jgi:hypothetical protein
MFQSCLLMRIASCRSVLAPICQHGWQGRAGLLSSYFGLSLLPFSHSLTLSHPQQASWTLLHNVTSRMAFYGLTFVTLPLVRCFGCPSHPPSAHIMARL